MMEWARKALAIGSPDVGGAKERGAERYERVPKVVKAVAKRGGLLTGRFVSGDHQGTASVQVDAVSHEVFKQRSLPFGGPRGSQASGWSGEKGFVGGTIDTASTGLTHIGAREYDPDTGRFISVDPVLDPTDPRQMNGYAYANHSPVTYSDPTGLFACDANGNCWADGVTPVGVGAAVTGPSAPKNAGKAVGSPAPKGGVVQRVSSTDPVQELSRVATAGSPSGIDVGADPVVVDTMSVWLHSLVASTEHGVGDVVSQLTLLKDAALGATIAYVNTRQLEPRERALRLLLLGGSGSERKRNLRREGQQLASSLGYGNGKGNDNARLQAETQMLRRGVRLVPYVGIVADVGVTSTQEWNRTSGMSGTERRVRTGVKTTMVDGFAAGLGGMAGAACSPTVVGAAVCGAVGGYAGAELGETLADFFLDIAYG